MITTESEVQTRSRAGWLARLAVLVALIGGLLAASTTAASASAAATAGARTAKMAAAPMATMTASCGGGRCTVYLSKAETRDLADGRVPGLPGGVPWQLRAGYYALAYGHKWFAQQYANRGWCSGFRLSIYPWESQGYFGYAC